MQVLSRQRGASLIEVMIAVLIFSIGLIGLAGLLVMATRSNQSAYLRTQVAFLAHNMADRMGANPVGVWGGDYDGAYPVSANQDCTSAGCTPAQLATHDKGLWSSQLATFLPAGATANIACSKDNTGYTPTPDQVNMRPPYGGTCHMTLTWSERGAGDKSKRIAAPQTFAWEFQP